MSHTRGLQIAGFRLGIYVFKDAEIIDYAGPVVTAGGIASGMEMGFHLLRRAGYDESFIAEVARTMEYTKAYEIYRDDIEGAGASSA